MLAETDAFLVTGAQAAAVVDDVAAQHVAVAPHRDRDRALRRGRRSRAGTSSRRAAGGTGSGTRASRVSGSTSIDTREPVAEAQAHDLDVALQEVELRLERHFLRADVLQRHAEQIAQRRDHRVGAAHVLVHQRRDRVQRVEQEVRLQLHAQHLQLRLREPRLELRRAQRAVLRHAVVDDGMVDDDDRAEDERVEHGPR